MATSEGVHGHHWPKNQRGTFPAYWLRWFGWRQFTAWTPKIAKRSVCFTLLVIPRRGALIGATWFTDDDGERVVRFGLGLVEMEAQVISWV